MSKINRKTAVIVLAGIIVISCLVYIFFCAFNILKLSKVPGEDNHSYSYHILVGSTERKSDYVKDFYAGAKYMSATYGGYAELLVPESMRDRSTLYDWMDYAQYVNADGLILISSDGSFTCSKIYDMRGLEIPVVVAGKCSPESVQSALVTSGSEDGSSDSGDEKNSSGSESHDAWEMGSTSASELFAWKATGYADKIMNISSDGKKGGTK